mmetsp:Transcript_49105/g.117999  ORF Transcript_49105/g.117999 Transcript_49105/m.117999 type:complete len:269 (+) Transcript_49105:1604-2410(+)
MPMRTLRMVEAPPASSWLPKLVFEQSIARGQVSSRPGMPSGLKALAVAAVSKASANITPSDATSTASMSRGEISACFTASYRHSCTAPPSSAVMWARLPFWLTLAAASAPMKEPSLTTIWLSTTLVMALSRSEMAHSPRTKPPAEASKLKTRPAGQRRPPAQAWTRNAGCSIRFQLWIKPNGMGSHLPVRDKFVLQKFTATSEDADSTSTEMHGPFIPWTKENRPHAILPPPPQTPLEMQSFSAIPHSEGGGLATYTPPRVFIIVLIW